MMNAFLNDDKTTQEMADIHVDLRAVYYMYFLLEVYYNSNEKCLLADNTFIFPGRFEPVA